MTDATKTAQTPTNDRSNSSGRTPRRRYWLLAAPLLLLAAVYFAPMLVAVTPLRQQIIPGLFPKLDARSNVGSASLGWFAPVVLYDTQIRSTSGEPLLSAASVTSEHTLLGLITDQIHLGRFDIEQPRAHIVLRDDGSNLEDAVAPMLAEEAAAPKEFSLEIRDAAVLVREAAEGASWRVSNLESSIDLPLAGEKSISVKGEVALGEDAPSGSLSLAVQWHAPDAAEGAKAGSGRFDVDVGRLPLVISRGALRRFLRDAQVSGEADVKCRGQWSVPEKHVEARIALLRGDDLRLTAPGLLAEDHVNIASLRGAGGIVVDGQQVSLDTLSLEVDPANLTASGRLNFADLQQGNLVDAVFAQQVATTGTIDLAKLAAMLPETLRVRQDTHITSGEIAWDLTSREEDGRQRIVGRLDATGLAAENAGQTITWQRPIQLTVAAEQTAQGPVVEQLKCTSDFLQVSGSGSLRQASMTVDCSLDELRAELGRFVDLGEFELNGSLDAKANWQRGEQGRLTADGELNIEKLSLVLPGIRPWQEPRLTARINATGLYKEDGSLQLDQAGATVEAGEDVLRADLLEPVADAGGGEPLPVRLEVQGRIAAWLARAQLFLPLQGWRMDGRADIKAMGKVSPTSVALSTLEGRIEQLMVQGAGLFINEPDVRLTAKELAASTNQGPSFSVVDATLATSAISFRAENVRAVAPPAAEESNSTQPASLRGNVLFRSDLNRLCGWFEDPRAPLPVIYSGTATGSVAVDLSQGVSTANVDITVKEFEVSHQTGDAGEPRQPFWYEPEVKIIGQASYDGRNASAGLKNLTVQSTALSVTASGQVADLTERVVVDLDGQLAYDLERISPVLRPYLGEDFLLTGRKNETFSVHGPVLVEAPKAATAPAPAVTGAEESPPVVSNELKAQAGLGWDSARAFALDVGPGSIDVRLDNGVAKVTPIDLPVSGGRVQLAPQLLLNRQPMLMVADKGPVFENVALTPMMCRTWLKYVAPLLAEATEVKGKFSTTLKDAAVPLNAPLDGDVQGALTVHAAEVGPGPLGRQILLMARQIEYTVRGKPLEGFTLPQTVWMSMPQQTIDFQMANRGVRHKNLRFLVGDVEVRTEGLVNFDQSIDLLASVPVRDEWTTRPWLADMKGKSIKIPLKGTLTEPKVDDSVWRELTARMVRGTTERLLDRGLKRLFGPKD